MKIVIQVSSVEIFKVIAEEIFKEKKSITINKAIAILDNRGIPYLTELSKDGKDYIRLEFGI